VDSTQAAQFLSNYDFGLAGLDDVLDVADETLGCVFCGYDGYDGLGFVGQPLSSSAKSDAQKVVAAAAQPGTETTKVVAGKLARKGVALGKLAHDRAQVARKAREKRDQLARKVEKLQPKVDKLLASNSTKDREVGAALKQDQLSAARAAVRLEKVNAVASGTAENAAAQAVIAQQIAASVIAGKPALTATLSSMFNKLGRSSASMKKIRQEQIVNSAKVLDQDKVRALLARKRALLKQVLDIDVLLTCDVPHAADLEKKKHTLYGQIGAINKETKKLCVRPRPTALDELESPTHISMEGLGELAAKFDPKAAAAKMQARRAATNREPILDAKFEKAKKKGWIRLTNKSANIKTIPYLQWGGPPPPGVSGAQTYGDLDLKVAQAARGTFKHNPKFPGGKQFVPDMRPLLKGQLNIVEQRIGRKLSRWEKDLLRHPAQFSRAELAKKTAEYNKAYKKFYRRGVEKSGSLYRVAGVKDVLNTAKAVAKPVVNVAKAAVETAVLPATTAVKLVTKGPAAAIKNVSRTMKRSFDTVRKAAGQLFVGLPCQLANSSVGKAAMQIGASAVGTAVGGPAGTVAGAVAANRSQAITKSVCGGLDKIGLTKGDFRTSKLGAALKQTAQGIGRNLTDPKALLKDAQSIGTAVVPGVSNATQLLNKFGGSQLQKLGLNQIAKNINLPGGASQLLKSAGIPSSVPGLLRKAGLPTSPASVLRAAGVSPNVKAVLKRAGVPTDLTSMVKSTQILKGMKLPVTPDNIARAMNVKPIPIPGMPGKFKLPRVLPKAPSVGQLQQSARKRAAIIRRVAAQQARARKLFAARKRQVQRVLPVRPTAAKGVPRVTFARGSTARTLVPFVRR
jgi:hypothetical protein